MGCQWKDVAETHWALFWKEVVGTKTAKARVVAEGYTDPVLRNGMCVREIAPCAVHILGGIGEWAIRSFDIQNALSRRMVLTVRFT